MIAQKNAPRQDNKRLVLLVAIATGWLMMPGCAGVFQLQEQNKSLVATLEDGSHCPDVGRFSLQLASASMKREKQLTEAQNQLNCRLRWLEAQEKRAESLQRGLSSRCLTQSRENAQALLVLAKQAISKINASTSYNAQKQHALKLEHIGQSLRAEEIATKKCAFKDIYGQ